MVAVKTLIQMPKLSVNERDTGVPVDMNQEKERWNDRGEWYGFQKKKRL